MKQERLLMVAVCIATLYRTKIVKELTEIPQITATTAPAAENFSNQRALARTISAFLLLWLRIVNRPIRLTSITLVLQLLYLRTHDRNQTIPILVILPKSTNIKTTDRSTRPKILHLRRHNHHSRTVLLVCNNSCSTTAAITNRMLIFRMDTLTKVVSTQWYPRLVRWIQLLTVLWLLLVRASGTFAVHRLPRTAWVATRWVPFRTYHHKWNLCRKRNSKERL